MFLKLACVSGSVSKETCQPFLLSLSPAKKGVMKCVRPVMNDDVSDPQKRGISF